MDHRTYNDVKDMVKEAMFEAISKHANGVEAVLDTAMNTGRSVKGAVAGKIRAAMPFLHDQARALDPRKSTGIKDYFRAGDVLRSGEGKLHDYRVSNSVSESDAGHAVLSGQISKDALKTAIKRSIVAGTAGAGALGLGVGTIHGLTDRD